MADVRCANSEYQLDVDEMMLEYLVYNTLQAHIDEWQPHYRKEAHGADCLHCQHLKAPRLLLILDETIQLFKANHPSQKLSKSTAFYLELLEFLLLFIHERGGPSSLSEESYRNAHSEEKKNPVRRNVLWILCRLFPAIEFATDLGVYELFRTYVRDWRRYEGMLAMLDISEDHVRNLPTTPLIDLISRFMELREKSQSLTETSLDKMWLLLAKDFMLQAAIEVVGLSLSDDDLRLVEVCDFWKLLIRVGLWPTEKIDMVEDEFELVMLLPIIQDSLSHGLPDIESTQGLPWSEKEIETKPGFHELMTRKKAPSGGMYLDEEYVRYKFEKLQRQHPTDVFEKQVVQHIKHLQVMWAQDNGKPVLLQIEQGRLKGLNEDEFHAFMQRVGIDDHELPPDHINVLPV